MGIAPPSFILVFVLSFLILSMKRIVILGAGPGGYPTAVAAAKAGCEVHLIDDVSKLGGTCLCQGCIPTKALCHTAEVLRHTADAAGYGVKTDMSTFSLAAAIERKDGIISQLQAGIQALLKGAGVHFHPGRATFHPSQPRTVCVGDETLTADAVIIATGSRPRLLPVEGVDAEGVLTSDTILRLTELPRRLCVVGGGVIGLEFASVFSAFGCEVSVVEYGSEIAPTFDTDISRRLKPALKKQGIRIVTDAPVTGIHTLPDGSLSVAFTLKGKEDSIVADKVLMAVGREPVTDGLQLEQAGIEIGKRGIIVDEHYRTSCPGVYAIGDVNGGIQLAHVATFQGKKALAHILGCEEQTDMHILPACLYTHPEAASVGLTEKEAKEQGREFSVRKAFYRANGRALTMDAGMEGFFKLLIGTDGTLLGAHIMGPGASELIHEATAWMSCKATVEHILRTIHAHPTLSEIYLDAAEA